MICYYFSALFFLRYKIVFIIFFGRLSEFLDTNFTYKLKKINTLHFFWSWLSVMMYTHAFAHILTHTHTHTHSYVGVCVCLFVCLFPQSCLEIKMNINCQFSINYSESNLSKCRFFSADYQGREKVCIVELISLSLSLSLSLCLSLSLSLFHTHTHTNIHTHARMHSRTQIYIYIYIYIYVCVCVFSCVCVWKTEVSKTE